MCRGNDFALHGLILTDLLPLELYVMEMYSFLSSLSYSLNNHVPILSDY